MQFTIQRLSLGAVCLIALMRELSERVEAGPWQASPIRQREEQIDPDSLLWQSALTLRTSGGWRDNSLLAGTNSQATPFAGWGLEFFLFRMPVDQHRFTLMFIGDDRRYVKRVELDTAGGVVNGETVMSTHADYRGILSDNWSWNLLGQHLYADQVFDASTLEDGNGGMRATVHGFTASPSIRWNPIGGFRIDLGYQWQRQNFEQPLDGFWAMGPKATVGLDYGSKGSVEAAIRQDDRAYDSRPAANLLGGPQLGTVAYFTQRHAELVFKNRWIDRPRIQSTLRLFYLGNGDQEVGFYDFDRFGIGIGLKADWKAWTMAWGCRWSEWSYERQFVSPAPEDLFKYRRREDLEFNVRLERRLGSHLTLFVEELFETQRSNVELENFQSHTVQCGLEWEF